MNNKINMNWPFLVQVLLCFKLLMFRLNFGNLSAQGKLACTVRGGPSMVREARLKSSSLGGLSDANFQLWRGETNTGSSAFPNTTMAAAVDADLQFTILPSSSSSATLYGYLVRIAGADSRSNFEPVFIGDSRQLGILSFCSALGLLDSGDAFFTGQKSMDSATFRLHFTGNNSYQVTMDIIASSGYDFYYDRFRINLVVGGGSSSTGSPPPRLRPSTPSPFHSSSIENLHHRTSTTRTLRQALTPLTTARSARTKPDFLDCTLNGGPEDVNEATLRRASLGSLGDANVQLWRGEVNSGSLVSPNRVIQGTMDTDLHFTILPSSSSRIELSGYLVRIDGALASSRFEPFFIADPSHVGTVTFCSALDLLDTDIFVTRTSMNSAEFRLYFDGTNRSNGLQVTMDVIASRSSGTSHEFYYDRFRINLVTRDSIPMAPPSPSPTSRLTSFPPATTPTIELWLRPTISPTADPSVPPTTIPTTEFSQSPTLAPTTESNLHSTSKPTRSTLQSPPNTPSKETALSTSLSSSPTNDPNVTPHSPTPATPTPISSTIDASGDGGLPSSMVPSSSSSASSAPPASGPFSKNVIRNLKITLDGVSVLDANATREFVATTEAWFEDYYRSTNTNKKARGRRRRRKLLQGIISDLSTTVTVQQQEVTPPSEGRPVRNRIVYDQGVSYVEMPGNLSVDPLDLVIRPFNDAARLDDYLIRLRKSQPAFQDLSAAAPDQSQASLEKQRISGGSQSLSGGGAKSLSGAVFAVSLTTVVVLLGVLALTFLSWHRRHRKNVINDGDRRHLPIPVDMSDEEKEQEEGQLLSLEPGPFFDNIDQTRDVLIPGVEPEVSTMCSYSFCGNSTDGEDNNVGWGSAASGDFAEASTIGFSMVTKDDKKRQEWVEKYSDERNLYTIDAPPGTLGIVFDTPDEGPLAICKVEETSVLLEKVKVGDRLIALDGQDITELPAAVISREITEKMDQPIRVFTFLRVAKDILL